MPDLGKAYVQIVPSAEGIRGSIESVLDGEADSAGRSAGSKIVAGIGGALAAGTAAVVAFGVESVKVGSNFDAAMSQVAATMGLTTAEIGDMRDFAQDTGATTAFSATQAAEALNYMALAGYDSGEAMSMLPTVLDLAAAGGMGLAQASDMVTDSQSALGLSFGETSTLVDQMAKTAASSNTSVAQLGEAILTVGGTAQYMAGGTEQLNMVLGILADNGIKGSEAGTHLRNMLLSLSSPTDNAAGMLEALGVSIFDAEGNMRDFAAIFPELDAAMSELTDQQKLDAMSAIFNSRDIAAATALMGTSVERWGELGEAIDGAAGSAAQMAATQLDNLQGDVTLLQSAFEGVQIAVSDELTGSLREFTQFGAQALSTLGDAIKTDGLAGGVAALGDILGDAINMIVGYIPGVVAAGGQLVLALVASILSNAPALAQAAVDLVVQLSAGLAGALPTLVPAAVEAVTLIVATLLSEENLMALLDAGLQLIMGLAQGLLAAVPQLIAALPGITSGIVDFLMGAIPMLLEAGIALLMGIVDAVPQIIPALVDAIPQIITSLVTTITQGVPLLIEAGITLLLALIDAIPQIVPPLIEAMPQIIEAICSGLLDNLPAIIDAGIQLFMALMEALPEILVSIVDAAAQIIRALIDAFVKAVPQMAETGKQIVQGLWQGIKDAWSWLTENISRLVSRLVDGVKGVLGIHSPSRVFADIGANMALGLGEGWGDGMSGVRREIEDSLRFDAAALSGGLVYGGPGIAGAAQLGGDTYNITIDAASVREFNDIVEIVQNRRRMGRMVTA